MTDSPQPHGSTLAGKSVLVTGGAGFIGSHLTDRLVDSCEVTVLDNFSAGRRQHVPEDADIIDGDVCDRSTVASAMREKDIVFHQAARVSVTESVNQPIRTHDVNVDGTLTILEQARATDTRVILASSTAIYGEPTSLPVSESDPKQPNSPYGLEKLSADHYARLYHELYGLETVALRYFNVYGPRQQSGQYGGVVSIFVDQALNGGPITVHGDGTQTRDFVAVQDVVSANLRAATTSETGSAFNIGTGAETSIVKLAKLVQELVPESIDIVHEDARPGDIERSYADITKAKKQLGYAPTTGIEAGIETLVDARR